MQFTKIINGIQYSEFSGVPYRKYEYVSVRKGNGSLKNMIILQKGRNYG
jgi:hypothetical protein